MSVPIARKTSIRFETHGIEHDACHSNGPLYFNELSQFFACYKMQVSSAPNWSSFCLLQSASVKPFESRSNWRFGSASCADQSGRVWRSVRVILLLETRQQGQRN